jgi:hypothetical protein
MKKLLVVLAIVAMASTKGKAQLNTSCSCDPVPSTAAASTYQGYIEQRINCYTNSLATANLNSIKILFTQSYINPPIPPNNNVCYPSMYNHVIHSGNVIDWSLIQNTIPPSGTITASFINQSAQSLVLSIKQYINNNFGATKQIFCISLIGSGMSGYPSFPNCGASVKFIGFNVVFGNIPPKAPSTANPVDSVPKNGGQ